MKQLLASLAPTPCPFKYRPSRARVASCHQSHPPGEAPRASRIGTQGSPSPPSDQDTAFMPPCTSAEASSAPAVTYRPLADAHLKGALQGSGHHRSPRSRDWTFASAPMAKSRIPSLTKQWASCQPSRQGGQDRGGPPAVHAPSSRFWRCSTPSGLLSSRHNSLLYRPYFP